MFVDASAIVAILAREPEADELRARLEAAPQRATSALAVYEATLAIARTHGWTVIEAELFVSRFLAMTEIVHIAIGEREGAIALEAFHRFGKGRHPAGLNMGDCFAYACARQLGVPLLYKGDDFSRTDIEAG